MTAKPICVVYMPFDSGFETKVTWSMCKDIVDNFDKIKPDYHWFFIPSEEHTIMEFNVFYEKDFTPIQYEELKDLIKKAIEK